MTLQQWLSTSDVSFFIEILSMVEQLFMREYMSDLSSCQQAILCVSLSCPAAAQNARREAWSAGVPPASWFLCILIGNEVQRTRAMNGHDGKRHSRGEAAVREPPARIAGGTLSAPMPLRQKNEERLASRPHRRA
jgi:hypothetical protein